MHICFQLLLFSSPCQHFLLYLFSARPSIHPSPSLAPGPLPLSPPNNPGVKAAMSPLFKAISQPSVLLSCSFCPIGLCAVREAQQLLGQCLVNKWLNPPFLLHDWTSPERILIVSASYHPFLSHFCSLSPTYLPKITLSDVRDFWRSCSVFITLAPSSQQRGTLFSPFSSRSCMAACFPLLPLHYLVI